MSSSRQRQAIDRMLEETRRKPTRARKAAAVPPAEAAVRIQGYFPPALARALRVRAIEERRRVSAVIVEAVQRYLGIPLQ